jgi:hypothetical protein
LNKHQPKKTGHDKNGYPAIPPWGTAKLWHEINQSFALHLKLFHDQLIQARLYAKLIKKNFQRIFPLMDNLCSKTCPVCIEACCVHAKPWYDFKDLVYLHLCKLPIPTAQPIGQLKDSCRYLTPNGCNLPRQIRPWICTWYLCPTQKTILNLCPSTKSLPIDSTLTQIKAYRKTLENEFIQKITDN